MTPEDAALVDGMLALTRTQSTAQSYRNHLEIFLAFAGWTPSQLLAKQPREVEDKVLDFYASHRDWSRGRVNIMKCSISLFGEAHERDYTWKRLKRALPKGNKKPRDRAPTTEEGRILLKHADVRERAMLLTTSSSGIRRGAVAALRMQDLTPLPSGIVKVIAYAGEAEEYPTFITGEAWAAVQDYLRHKKINGEPTGLETSLFTGEGKPLTSEAVGMAFRRLGRKAGVKGFKATHGWRKFFKTRCEQGTKTLFVETLLGHRTGLQESYFKPTEEELAAEYLKCVPFLTFSPEFALKKELEEEKGRNNDLQKTVLRIESELVMIRSWIAQLPPYAVVPPSARQSLEAGRQSDSEATP